MLESAQMHERGKPEFAFWVFIAVALSVLLTGGCRHRVQPGEGDGNMEPAGEPERYSATVVRIVDDGKQRETTISRQARSGEQRREEWTEAGQNRALIWRPDLGKSFLLDLDRRTYVQMEIGGGGPQISQARANNPNETSAAKRLAATEAETSLVQGVDHYFADTQPPSRVQTRALPAELIEGHSCVGYEQSATFPDGHVETTRRFRASDLSGLLLRVETAAENATTKVITERRDIRLEVAPDLFIVPGDFKRVEKLVR